MLTERPSVYLASKSPRRQELLRQIGVEFEELLLREAPGRRRDIVEVPRKDEAPFEYVKRVARTKAAVGWHRMGRRELPPKPVLGGRYRGRRRRRGAGQARRRSRRGRDARRDCRAARTTSLTAVAIRWNAQIALGLSVSRVTLPRHRARRDRALHRDRRAVRQGRRPTRSRDAPRPSSAAWRAATRE